MRSPQLQQRFIAAHGGLRALLGRYLGVHPSQLRFARNEFGKPALSGQFRGRLTFNLSHSPDLALIGIAADAEIGVDLEHIRDEPEFTEIAQWFFAPAEVEVLNRVPSELRTRAFLSSWTRKEAYAKARGRDSERRTRSLNLQVGCCTRFDQPRAMSGHSWSREVAGA